MNEVVREGFGEWEWIELCERVGKLGCFWKMNGNVVEWRGKVWWEWSWGGSEGWMMIDL